ncbi:MAG: cation-transporting P-type ATPase, partial [Caldimonas sp.]
MTDRAHADPSLADAVAVAAALAVDPKVGLSAAEAARRLAADGANVLRPAAETPWWRRILAQLRDPLVMLLLAAIAVSLAAWRYDGG